MVLIRLPLLTKLTTTMRIFPSVRLKSPYSPHRLFSTPAQDSPLAGIRVLDLTRIVAGPFCTMILGDLGAEVLKIEMPNSGDEARKWGPPFIEGTSESCYFLSLNRNKKSVCINLKSDTGREIIYELVKKCDVLIENYVPGKLKSLGLSYEDVKDIAPHLIYCSLTGYGPNGPYSKRPGYDVIASSVGGLIHITGPKGGEPCKVGVAMTDIATGLYAHGAIMAALLQRVRTGKGQKIDCDLLSTQVACLINIGSNYLNGGLEAVRRGTEHGSIVPYQAFPTSDGHYLTVGAGSDHLFKALCKKLDMEELSTDPRFSNNAMRVKNRNILITLLRERFQQKTLSEWLKILEDSQFPYGPVNNMSQVFNDPHIEAIGLIKEVQHPVGKTVKLVGPPVQYSDSVNAVRLPPPLLGQHTADVLKEILDYSEEKIQELQSSGVVQ
ncbi:succinate--hydroxymethylglutarate CoA-transferase [Anabrus simplex]|uniref:succinate--hydroxymethylglutarate CoA-transferase n=1 Tax=Anabrus simplex TaxID=316456 RepID=UPI0035A35EF2